MGRPQRSDNTCPAGDRSSGHVVDAFLVSGSELETRRCGWWVDVGVAPLEQALRLATRASADELREMGSRGKALASGKYEWDGIAAKMLETYEWVLGRRGAPSFVYA